MKKLIIVRHGEYDTLTQRLNEIGVDQVQRLAGQLKPLVQGLSILVLSSPAPRAADSARILAKSLRLKGYEQHEMLWSGDSPRPQDNSNVLQLVNAHAPKADVLVLVTHMEYCNDLPWLFGKILGVQFTSRGLERGQALVIDWEEKSEMKLA